MLTYSYSADMLVVIAIESFVIVLLIMALLAGQPSAAQAGRVQVEAQSTEIAQWKATVTAYPSPTVRRCYTGGSAFVGYPAC